MRRLILRVAFLIALVLSGAAQRTYGLESKFVGSTPCDAGPRRFLGIAAAVSCERITWELVLSGRTPSSFVLRIVYGMQARNAPGFDAGGTAITLNGDATAGGDAIVRLSLERAARSLAFRKIGHNLLHLLDERSALMIGNGGWSYTLSRAGTAIEPDAPASFVPASDRNLSAAAVFDGRTPCQGIAAQMGVRAGTNCAKLKWRLKLYHDTATRAPTRYVLEGTLYRSAPRTGRWTVVTRKDNPNVLVYQLDPDRPGATLSLLRADDNILFFLNRDGGFLVGDSFFSYTLNRVG